MDLVSEQVIGSVQEKLVACIEREYGLERNVLVYDTTNFFTFLATSNSRGPIAKRGRSKVKRHDLRQVGLALLVMREGQEPLNVPCSVSLFRQTLHPSECARLRASSVC